MNGSLKIGLIIASVREGRKGEAFARWFEGILRARDGVEVEVLDLKDWPIGSYTHPKSAVAGEKDYSPGSLEGRWRDTIAALDGFVIVTPEYNHGYPGALKNALDALFAAWNRKAVAFVSYGGFSGGTRAVEQLRLVAVELRMVPVRDEVNLRLIGLTTDDKGAPTEELYAKRAAMTIDDLLWWTRATKAARATT